MTQGRFITVEGIEGAGKTTQARFLTNELVRRGFRVVPTREPGGTPAAEDLRKVFLDHGWDGFSELCLLVAGRRHNVQNLIRPALARGDWVVCDRFTATTFAYQGFGRGVSPWLVDILDDDARCSVTPDLTVILDLPPDEALARVAARGVKDRMEALGVEFFTRVRKGFLSYAGQHVRRCAVVDAAPPRGEVHQNILRVLQERNV